MSRTLIRIITGLMLLAAVAAGTATLPAQTAGARWETVDASFIPDPAEDIDVRVRDTYIYVYTGRPTTVRLLTILGQPVSQASLPAGTSRFKVRTRGIYILKAGSVTRRITI